MDPMLICTDLDRTLIPNGTQPESAPAAEYFAALVARPEVHLAYVSGRHRALIQDAIEGYGLPMPEYIIGDVGTSIDHRVGDDWRRMIEWDQRIAPDWNGHSREDLAAMLEDLSALRPQAEDNQNRFKLSYYHDAGLDTGAMAAIIAPRFEAADVRARLIWSLDETSDTGLLDVLPGSASKLHAIEALMRVTGFDHQRTVFCGDSGNDLEVLASEVPSVLVGNAQPAVRERALQLAGDGGQRDRLYLAEGGFLGMNGHYRGGMLEGIAHYHPEVRELLESMDHGAP